MSDTPRTDNCIDIANDEGIEDVKFCEVIANFARQLERELAEARTEINIIEHDANVLIGDIKAELECKNRLVEQMREALAAAKNDGKMQSAITYQLIRAALSAAERGEG